MRFRATLASHAFQVLSHLLQCFERLNGSSGAGRGKCAFLLSIETFTIALKERGDELQTFAKLSMERLFMDTILQSRAENRIGFLCDVKLFHKALLSGKNASAVTLRLLKKEGLSYMCLRTRAVDIDIVQHIPIEVLSIASMQLFREPNPPAPEIILEMPPTRTLKIVVDRLKSMDPSLMITIDDKGSLTLRIMKISLSVQTIFPYLKLRQDLRAPLEEATHENDEEEEKEENPTAVVDSKMFSQTLLLDESITKLLLCCISENNAVIMHFILEDLFGSFTCYLPVRIQESI